MTLEAPLDLLLKTPILHISGHETLAFSEPEKAKLKAYVRGGGTILAQACCSRKAFDASFRALVSELFGSPLAPISTGGHRYDMFGRVIDTETRHRIYERLKDKRGDWSRWKIEALALDDQGGRAGVIYLPNGIARKWHLGGSDAQDEFTLGMTIYFYITLDGRRMREGAAP